MTFGQSVYLIFTSVYVCKETIEHLLLSSGEGHHHHHGDEVSSVFGYVLLSREITVVVLTISQNRVPHPPIIYYTHLASLYCYPLHQPL